MPQQIAHFEAIAGRYKAAFVDLWGVLHDGKQAYASAIQCLRHLRQADFGVILISNAPRPSSHVAPQVERYGVPRDIYDGLVTSGDATIRTLNERPDAASQALGRGFYHIGPEIHVRTLLAALNEEKVPFEEAAYLLNSGPVHDESDRLEDYDPILRAALDRGLPMVCANPDRLVMRGAKIIPCAGSLAERYAAIGGAVLWQGKPDLGIYHMAHKLLGHLPWEQLLMVGDGLITDIVGAQNAGIDSLWIASGIHAGALPSTDDQQARSRAMQALFQQYQATPTYVTETLRW